MRSRRRGVVFCVILSIAAASAMHQPDAASEARLLSYDDGRGDDDDGTSFAMSDGVMDDDGGGPLVTSALEAGGSNR